MEETRWRKGRDGQVSRKEDAREEKFRAAKVREMGESKREREREREIAEARSVENRGIRRHSCQETRSFIPQTLEISL